MHLKEKVILCIAVSIPVVILVTLLQSWASSTGVVEYETARWIARAFAFGFGFALWKYLGRKDVKLIEQELLELSKK